ncbi:MAG TPA: D-aminoacyl-tRNA deacylase [Acidimicrobiia bacterium]|nr:D-aminoacyl-tRNA deacylase [Acidimicrobiia bacterium]
MRVVLQRVSEARVRVDGSVVSSIGPGLLLLVGVEPDDESQDVRVVVDKVANLRVFSDEIGKMNLSIGDVGGEILVVSQFTLLGDIRKGRRPSFTRAADPGLAAPLIAEMVDGFNQVGIPTGSGVFGAAMEVDLINEGPVTLVFSVRNARLD